MAFRKFKYLLNLIKTRLWTKFITNLSYNVFKISKRKIIFNFLKINQTWDTLGKGKLKKKTSEFKWESVFSGGVRKGQNLPLKKSKLKHLSCSSTVDINQNLTFKTSRNLNKRSQREFVSDWKSWVYFYYKKLLIIYWLD